MLQKVLPLGHRLFVGTCSYLSAFAGHTRLHKPLTRFRRQHSSVTHVHREMHRRLELKKDIDFADNEKRIFSFLREVCQARCPDTTLRVAGGWVRDKLLGLESHDLDIALDNMMGLEFTEQIHAYLTENGREGEASHTGLIKANPEQSKHLETATMRLYGQMIDFVNLRSEEYSSDSRIPTMRIGTPSEDAYRRDFTMNSLFYNVTEGKIEDYTQQGISDLSDRIVRTPLPPDTTLRDDPLRVLRAVRFASRYAFALDGELSKAMHDAEIKQALMDKVSKERVGVEVDKMLSGEYPVHSAFLLHNHDLIEGVIFGREFTSTALNPISPTISDDAFKTTRRAIMLTTYDNLNVSPEDRRFIAFASVFSPLRDNSVKVGKKGKEEPLAKTVVRESLKMPNRDAEAVHKILSAVTAFEHVISGNMPRNRKAIGTIMREVGEYWRLGVIILASKFCLIDDDFDPTVPFNEKAEEIPAEAQGVLDLLDEVVNELGLDQVWQMKPLLNGKEVQDATNCPRGPAVGQAVKELIDWQLENRYGTKEAAIDYLKKLYRQ